jgi:hypothetical protein
MGVSGYKVKEKLVREYGLICMYCGIHVENAGELQQDHIWPRMRGGEYSHANLSLACRHCQRVKGFFTPHEFKAWLQRFVKCEITFHPHVEVRMAVLCRKYGEMENYGFRSAPLVPLKK